LPSIFVVMQLIVFGIEQMNPCMGIMKPENLPLKRNELIPFLSVAGDCKTGHRKLKTPFRSDGGCDDGIVSEDLFGLIGIGWFAPDADTCSTVIGKFGTTKAKSIGRLAYQR
jgi:hypothetical protein